MFCRCEAFRRAYLNILDFKSKLPELDQSTQKTETESESEKKPDQKTCH
jgi:hypothetical protein